MRNLLLVTLSRAPGARFLLVLAAIVLLCGCDDSAIRVYSVPKEDPWKLPPGWQEKEAKGMRAAQFTTPSTDGSEIDISIVPISLEKFGGSSADILNIWRQQMKLSPVQNAEEASKLAEKVNVGPVQGELYDMTSEENILNEKAKARTLVSVVNADGKMWFIKMTGDAAGVGQQKPVFLNFLKSVNFKNISPSAPSMSTAATTGRGRREAEREPLPRPDWEVPPGWSELPPGQFLHAKFTAAGDAGTKADINISVSPGDGGGVLFNINRWRKQVGLTEWDAAALEKNVTTIDAVGTKAMLVDLAGTDAQSGKEARSIGVIIPLGDHTWFYKLMGHPGVVEREKAAFLKFVSSAKHPTSHSNG